MSHHRRCCCGEAGCACPNGTGLPACCCLDPSDEAYCGADAETCHQPCYFDEDGEPIPGSCTCPGTGEVIDDCCCNGTCGSSANYVSRCVSPCFTGFGDCDCPDEPCCGPCPPVLPGSLVVCTTYEWADSSLTTYDGSGVVVQAIGSMSFSISGQLRWYNNPPCGTHPLDLGSAASPTCETPCSSIGFGVIAGWRADSTTPSGCDASLISAGAVPVCGGASCNTCAGTDYTFARRISTCGGHLHIAVPTSTALAAGIKGFVHMCSVQTACPPEALMAGIDGLEEMELDGEAGVEATAVSRGLARMRARSARAQLEEVMQ